MTDTELDTLRADIRALRSDLTGQISQLRIEWRQEMLTQIRWLAGLFVVQLLTTITAFWLKG